MSGNIIRSIFLLRRSSTLLKKYSLPQILFIRKKQSTVSSKDQRPTETDEDEDINKPIKYSMTKAYRMKHDAYRVNYNDDTPWYQIHCAMISIAVFLIYFCILREENDIDLLLYTDLNETMTRLQKEKLAKSQSK